MPSSSHARSRTRCGGGALVVTGPCTSRLVWRETGRITILVRAVASYTRTGYTWHILSPHSHIAPPSRRASPEQPSRERRVPERSGGGAARPRGSWRAIGRVPCGGPSRWAPAWPRWPLGSPRSPTLRCTLSWAKASSVAWCSSPTGERQSDDAGRERESKRNHTLALPRARARPSSEARANPSAAPQKKKIERTPSLPEPRARVRLPSAATCRPSFWR